MRRAAVLFLLALCHGAASAQEEPAAFTPPQAYPADRYEAMWGKNPFTLKTAPAAVENISFAKDLAIGSHYGDTENPTVVIVNTKTHERTRLRKGETAPNGMKLASVKIGATRKETSVEVTLGSETTELSYNSDYLSQVATTRSAKTPANGRPGPGVTPAPGMPMPVNGQPQIQQRGPGMAPPGIKMPGPPNMTRPAPAGGSARNGTAPSGLSMGGVPPANGNLNVSNNGSLNVTLSPNGQVQAPQNSTLVSQTNPNAPPVPVRRRMISPAANEALPQ